LWHDEERVGLGENLVGKCWWKGYHSNRAYAESVGNDRWRNEEVKRFIYNVRTAGLNDRRPVVKQFLVDIAL
jgi:hypothetical protein